ncbi:N-acylneuraminate cytidylyltransferase [Okibacterium endophyticum]
MDVIAVIPARGGSRGVIGKNLRMVGGVTLIERAVSAAGASAFIDSVVVTTDDPAIAAVARDAGARIVQRPADLAGPVVSSETALLHVLDQTTVRSGGTGEDEPSILVFIQATSPFIDPADIDLAITRVRTGENDVVFSAAETHSFLWRETPAGAEGVNHNAAVRPMRQEREPHYRETGAFYVMRTEGFREAAHRFFGRVGVQVVDPRGAIDIDTVADLEIADLIAPVIDAKPRRSAAVPPLRAVVTDFDGVHTDDRAHIGADGSEFVTVSRADGMGVRLLRESGLEVLILSTEQNPVVGARGRKLGVEVLQGVSDKADALRGWAARRGVPLAQVAYLGNDVNDLDAMQLVGWPVCVPEAPESVRSAARMILRTPGGQGAVRELADGILDANARRGPADLSQPAPRGESRERGAPEQASAAAHELLERQRSAVDESPQLASSGSPAQSPQEESWPYASAAHR